VAAEGETVDVSVTLVVLVGAVLDAVRVVVVAVRLVATVIETALDVLVA
jgi:hypothetical protein